MTIAVAANDMRDMVTLAPNSHVKLAAYFRTPSRAKNLVSVFSTSGLLRLCDLLVDPGIGLFETFFERLSRSPSKLFLDEIIVGVSSANA